MLRRLPTQITITQDDLTTFEDLTARHLAYLHYKKTGEDPEGLFTSSDDQNQQQRRRSETAAEKAVDPNDELKPLPGDRGRAVRGREERITGVPGARGR